MANKQYEDALARLPELERDLKNLDYGHSHVEYYCVDAIKSALQDKINGGWQDISTAPKDGTKVLLKNGAHMSTAQWSWDIVTWDENECPIYSDSEGEWMLGFAYQLFPSPTHWQPLPQPPKGE